MNESKKILEAQNISLYYSSKKAINNVSLSFETNQVTALIGPSGCGKSTFLRAFNRMNDFIEHFSQEGKILFNGKNVKKMDPVKLRAQVGMVFQKPNPFPKSISKNITWGPKINGYKGDLDVLVEKSLQRAGLWNEVKDRLKDSALGLSGGQQQRLCIARTIAMSPEVILMDEPCSALDPRSTLRIESLIEDFKKKYTIIIVTHNMQQAARVSDETCFLYEGQLIEKGVTSDIFTKPKEKATEDYITGRFG